MKVAEITRLTLTPTSIAMVRSCAVARIAFARAGPLLRALGLPLQDVNISDDRVMIRTGTPRAGVLLSPLSAVALTRHVLRETVSENIQVVHSVD